MFARKEKKKKGHAKVKWAHYLTELAFIKKSSRKSFLDTLSA